MGPLKLARNNGLSVSRKVVQNEVKDEQEQPSNDEKVSDFSFSFWK